MSWEIKAPRFPESISEGTIAAWHKAPGDSVRRDELLVDVETEKVTIEVVAQESGRLQEVLKSAGDTVHSEEVLGLLDVSVSVSASPSASAASPSAQAPSESTEQSQAPAEPAPRPKTAGKSPRASPAVKKLAAELGVDLETIDGSGRQGRILRADVQHAAEDNERSERQAKIAGIDADNARPVGEAGEALSSLDEEARVERRVPMSRLRASIARRLVEAQHNAAMLTTFNEVDMSEVMRMREKYKVQFAERHKGVRLGFMSFFVSAAVEALKRFPAVNASIDGTDIVYHGYYDIGVAVSTDAGLLVPVIRDADALGLAQIEEQIVDYSAKARDSKLSLEELTGGTFTISNGGIFGSLLSTPILNPPQTAILGMHKIQQRPVVVEGEIFARPMMYLALSYDHRLIDGREAVQFLVTIKEMVEDPARLLLEI